LSEALGRYDEGPAGIDGNGAYSGFFESKPCL
jgi:hypothetical protein